MTPQQRYLWPAAGIVTLVAGLLTSEAAARLLSVRSSPVVAVAESIIEVLPEAVVKPAINLLQELDKPFLVAVILVALLAFSAFVGRVARDSGDGSAQIGFALLGGVGLAAVLFRESGVGPVIPVAVGAITWVVVLPVLTKPLREGAMLAAGAGDDADRPLGESRRAFLVRAGVVGGVAVLLGLGGSVLGAGRSAVESARRSLSLTGVTDPEPPAGSSLDVDDLGSWQTPNDEFYRIDTAIAVPTVSPDEWSLRIHGMVENELTLTYDDLVSRSFTESWVTLTCVSNPVGGDLIGNARWSGVRVADLLAEAGVTDGADAVKQTSSDGWTCGTPLEALTDDRDALLAVAMNGEPLPIEHGFPVRVVVPGLYGYVSATKWVTDLEVTRFADFSAYWTDRGWAEKGPIKLASRVDVPRSGASVDAGTVALGGVAWAQHTGIEAVEVSVDGGAWQACDLGTVPSADTWVQWSASVDLDAGDHTVRVRATDAEGTVQDSTVRDVLPDGATGYHQVDFTAS
ncbi:molybdopterin-dependent oxidoreductase [Nocardioides bruguierae]|uniref:molybdopterin-dependent oxidoreductase n=1 Tax=Nocardioides bruguierae TaxID=2945102 RepID=UPI0020227A43|nr:molybdopterin-dependent oxidoreductase [Nocardioides bruguierae]MCL8024118.1 molybdopterin-dependent oxidoreductase [Nocardioides bruguierae]